MATEVASAADLNNVRTNLSGDYIQVADIDMSGYGSFTPIGTDANRFVGSYDGQGYSINNITIAGGADSTGLFGSVGSSSFENINISDLSINTYNTFVGGLIGHITEHALVDITNCKVTGSISAGVLAIGGLIGYGQTVASGSTISKCRAVVDITVDAEASDMVTGVGGLIGISDGFDIDNSFARRSITIIATNIYYAEYVGGFVGSFGNGSVLNCYAACEIDLSGVASDDIGGLIGSAFSATISYSYYDQDLSGLSDVGKGIPRSTAEMTYPENFTTTFIDWNFTNIWRHDPTYTINDGYPHLEVGFNIWVKKSGAWLQVTEVWVKKGGVWQAVTDVSTLKGGSWNTV